MARIVVMDDSKIMRRILSQFVEHGGHEVQAWEPMSAMEISERVAQVQPDLLITDFQMPGANGSTVARMARKANPKLRIIVDEFNKRYEGDEGDIVDLVAEKTLFIARALDPKELAGGQ